MKIGLSSKNNEEVFKYKNEHDIGVDYVNLIFKKDFIREMWDKKTYKLSNSEKNPTNSE